MKAWEFLTEAPAAPTAPVAPAQPAAVAPIAAKPAGQQPFKPTQTMDPQQAAAANKAAQEFMAQLTAKLQGLVSAQPTNEQRLTEGNWLTDKLAAAVDWVKDTIAKNPLIEIGLRLIPSPAQPVLAILDVIQAVRSNSIGEAVASLAKVVGGPAGQQLAQAAQGINIGSAVASGDIAGAATQAANAAGLKDVSAGIQTAKAATSGDISGAAQTAANAAGLKDVSAGIQTAKAATSGDMAGAADAAGLKNVATGIKGAEMVKALSETAELNRILKLSGLEFIAEDSTKSVTVQRGDTLGRIASDNSTTVDAIVKLNNIANPDRIYPGDVIKLPGGQGDPGGRAKRQGPPSAADTDSDPDHISREERALLNMIARRESSDDYNAINYKAKDALKKGKMQITGDTGHHPFEGQSGTTAAGRYQMLWNTWKTAAKWAGVDPENFSPGNQDRAALALAKWAYKNKYGGDLSKDIKDPKLLARVIDGLTPWSVKSGGPGFTTQHYASALSDVQAA